MNQTNGASWGSMHASNVGYDTRLHFVGISSSLLQNGIFVYSIFKQNSVILHNIVYKDRSLFRHGPWPWADTVNCIVRRNLVLRSCRASQPIWWSTGLTLLVRPMSLQVYLAYRRCTISNLKMSAWTCVVPDSASILQNGPNEGFVNIFHWCWSSAEPKLQTIRWQIQFKCIHH